MVKPHRACCFAAMIFLCGKGATAAPPVYIDQLREGGSSFYFVNNRPYTEWQQEVVVGSAGRLVGIDILPRISPEVTIDASVLFYVNQGTAWQYDRNEFERAISMAEAKDSEWFHIDVSSANIYVSVSETFVWGITGIQGLTLLYGQLVPEYPGRLWIDSLRTGIAQHGSNGMAFRTYVQVIPEPNALFLGTIPLLGLLLPGRSGQGPDSRRVLSAA